MSSARKSDVLAIIGENSESIKNILIKAMSTFNAECSEYNGKNAGLCVFCGSLEELKKTFTSESISVFMTDASLVGDSLSTLTNLNSIVVPYNKAVKYKEFVPDGTKIYSYAIEDNMADFIAKNVRTIEECKTFEFLCPVGIGRIRIKDTDTVSVENILGLAGIMVESGASLVNIIKGINNAL